MHQVTDFASVNSAVLAQLRPYLGALSREKRAELAETWIRIMAGEPVGESVFPDSTRLSVLLDTANRVKEIQDSLLCLSKVPEYLANMNSIAHDPQPSVWLAYHMTGWMEEVYILKLRWISFSTRLDRLYRREPDSDAIRETLAKCDENLTKALEHPLKFRSAHVHERRHVDPRLAQLRSIESAVQYFPALRDKIRMQAESIRMERVEFMITTNRNLEYLFDWFAEDLKPIFFPDGEWRMPRRLTDR